MYSTFEHNQRIFKKSKAERSFGRHIGGQEYAFQRGGQYKSYYFVEKSKCHKISPLNAFPLISLSFECKILFMCSINFWLQQDSNSLFKGSIGHITSQCKWRIVFTPLPFMQVSFKSFLLSRKLYLSWTTGQDLFQALVYSYVMVQLYPWFKFYFLCFWVWFC